LEGDPVWLRNEAIIRRTPSWLYTKKISSGRCRSYKPVPADGFSFNFGTLADGLIAGGEEGITD
jgi:hypothetical protein